MKCTMTSFNVKGVDYCSMGHSCDENATCMNLNTKYTCKCNQGFQGDGITCEGNVLFKIYVTYNPCQYISSRTLPNDSVELSFYRYFIKFC